MQRTGLKPKDPASRKGVSGAKVFDGEDLCKKEGWMGRRGRQTADAGATDAGLVGSADSREAS